MLARTRPDARRLLERPLLGRLLAGRLVAGPAADDAVRAAGDLVAAGFGVALEHVPGEAEDAPAALAGLIGRVHAAGLAGACELTLPVARLGVPAAAELAAAAADTGLGVVLAGPDAVVRTLAGPATRIAVPAGEPDAEERCRALAAGRVRLVAGRGAAADLAFVRCLNVLMAGDGHPAVAATDPRLLAITGERAAWNGRTPETWEYVMPYGVRTDEQHRLVAAGYAVRVAVPSGTGAVAAVARRMAGRS